MRLLALAPLARVAAVAGLLAVASLPSFVSGCTVGVAAPPRAETSLAPPTPLEEVAVACTEGETRIAGHWRWTGSRYAWLSQSCVHRPGARWTAGEYVRCGDGWCWQEGEWVRP